MGLDEFMDIESNDNKSSDSKNSSDGKDNDYNITEKDGITQYKDGNVGPRGPYGYEKIDDYRNTIVSDIDTHGSLFKYHLPIFPHIENKDKYNRGDRYGGISGHQGTSCVSKLKTPLIKINREIIMIDTGQTSKDDCLSVLENRFDESVGPDHEVYLYIFAKTRNLVKMALGDEMTDSIGAHKKDEILKAVYDETYTRRFRKSNDGETKLNNHIEKW